ncbi:nucleoside triphosphate pyrophosphatase [Adlercreutzia sp. ZJ154]|uniref:Maf family protein n=1 Tax=Adlercreutzia sp. ZJ154 TaxID=2709790 RepID=UPI0013EACCEF|nr:Maf family protein [Adlercreutzia sp. ZJ154]
MDATDAPLNAPLNIILASGSPRRRDLLRDAGVKFTVRTPHEAVDEQLEPDQLIMPAEAAKKLAERKAGAVMQELLAESPVGMFAVIGADTMVVKGARIFGKPRNLEDAKGMLRELSGCTHQVITAVSVWMMAAPEAENISMAYRTFAEASSVTFRQLTEDEIVDYLRKGESFDKAGAYAIQGEGRALVESYEGALDNIIGLPVERLLREFPDFAS